MTQRKITPLQQKSYKFFLEMGQTKTIFSKQDILKCTGYSKSNVEANLSKRWRYFLNRTGNDYSVDLMQLPKDIITYANSMSQSNKYNREPEKPVNPPNVECYLNKAKESALLAIDAYNRPMTPFRTQGFTVMMMIAWTSLFHAIFERDKVDYHYYERGKPKIVDDEHKTWELITCIEKYPLSKAIKANLQLFIRLRNKIEHRYAPAIDLDLYGECQSLLCNFENLVVLEFGTYYSLSDALAFPLQVITSRQTWQEKSMKQVQKEHYQELKQFIDVYRADLEKEIYADMEYCFRVYLIPKTGNHITSSDIAIEFIQFDPNNSHQFEGIEKQLALIKETRVQVANQGNYKPSDVIQKVSSAIGRKFIMHEHTKAWKYYAVRGTVREPQKCKTKYCQYDEPHKDFIYTQAWIDFLVDQITGKKGLYA